MFSTLLSNSPLIIILNTIKYARNEDRSQYSSHVTFTQWRDFLPSERLSQISVFLLTICSGLWAFWSTFLTFSCVSTDQLYWNKWGYGSITWNMRWTRPWHCKHDAICEMKCHMFTSTASKARRAPTVSLNKVRLRAMSFWKTDWQGTKP